VSFLWRFENASRFGKNVTKRTAWLALARPLGTARHEIRSAFWEKPACFYPFTTIGEATRLRVLRIYDYNNTKTAIEFLTE
jgi:hypothetical protein